MAKPIWETRFQREMLEAERYGYPFKWGNIANLDPAVVEEKGIRGARLDARREEEEENANSLHRSSSGRTASLVRAGKTRKERNAIRRAHYERKGALEEAKENERRAAWLKRKRGAATESNWKQREKRRWLKRKGKGKGSAEWENHWAGLEKRRTHKAN